MVVAGDAAGHRGVDHDRNWLEGGGAGKESGQRPSSVHDRDRGRLCGDKPGEWH
jgi:hypothetical protein